MIGTIIDGILFLYFLSSVGYLLGFALLAQRSGRALPVRSATRNRRMAVLIPAYREDAVVEESVQACLRVDYPKEAYEVVVIADSMRPETVETLRGYPIRVVEMPEGVSSKARALTYAVGLLDGFDAAVVLDADNLCSPRCLSVLNAAFEAGSRAVQLHRTAKNLSPAFAYLDAVSEEINNTLFRKGPQQAGLSAALSGSGMAFDFDWFKDHIGRAQTAGEDKEIELMLLQERIHIAYIDEEPVLDEKVAKASSFYGQRRRWIATQYDLLKRILPDLGGAVRSGNASLAHKILQQFLLPRLLILGLLAILTLAVLLVSPAAALKWAVLLGLFGVTLWISIPARLKGPGLWRAAWRLPVAFGLLFLNLFRIRGAGKRFIHTAHGSDEAPQGADGGSRPLRIAVEAQRIFRENPHGMDVVALESLRALQRVDPVNEYYVFVKPGPNQTLQEGPRLHVVEVPGPTYPFWEQVALPLALRRCKPDMVHCTSNTAPLFPGVKRRVVTLHDTIFLEPQRGRNPSLYQRMGNLYRRWIVPQVVRRCSRIVTVSRTEAETIRGILGYAEKLEVAYNGLDRDLFRPVSDPELLRELELPERYYLFFGNTDPKKNTPRVLRAYRRYREESSDPLPLVVVDLDESVVRDALGAAADALLASGSVVLAGYVAHAHLPAVYGGAFAFLYPSLRESFGLPILEAMACGTPVITSDAAAMPEVAGPGALLIDPESEASISDAMLRLEREPGLREAQRAYGVERAARFTWEETARSLRTVYESLRPEGGASRG